MELGIVRGLAAVRVRHLVFHTDIYLYLYIYIYMYIYRVSPRAHGLTRD